MSSNSKLITIHDLSAARKEITRIINLKHILDVSFKLNLKTIMDLLIVTLHCSIGSNIDYHDPWAHQIHPSASHDTRGQFMELHVKCHSLCLSYNIAGSVHHVHIKKHENMLIYVPTNGKIMCISTWNKTEPHINPASSEEELNCNPLRTKYSYLILKNKLWVGTNKIFYNF